MYIYFPELGATYLMPTEKGEDAVAVSFDPSPCSLPSSHFCRSITLSAKVVLSPWEAYDGHLKMSGLLIAMLGYQWGQAAPRKLCTFSSFCFYL